MIEDSVVYSVWFARSDINLFYDTIKSFRHAYSIVTKQCLTSYINISMKLDESDILILKLAMPFIAIDSREPQND